MSLNEDAQKLEPGRKIVLYQLDLNSIGVGIVNYFYGGLDGNMNEVLFQGNSYTAWPIEMTPIEKRGDGASPRPSLIISNYQGLITNQIKIYQDLIGATVRKITTLSQYLNTNTVDQGAFAQELFFVEQKTNENSFSVEFVLSSAFDFTDVQLPRRVAIANTCPWQYKTTANGSGCGWLGTDNTKWFDRNGNQVATSAEDECGKRLTDCKLRFGDAEPLDFGGFPSLGRV